jgi:hypothetical protein
VLLVEDSPDEVDFGRYQNMLRQIVEYWPEAVVPPGGGDAIVEPASGANL